MNDLAEFMVNLLSMGMERAKVIEKGYDFALAVQIGNQRKGDDVTPTMMSIAASQVNIALPQAYRIYEMYNRMWCS